MLSCNMMNERAQFMWGAGSIILWLLTFLFIVGYYEHASSLKMHFTTREPPRGLGWKYWEDTFSPEMNISRGLSVAGCLNESMAPMCECLSESVSIAQSQCVNVGRKKMQQCFMSSRHVQYVTVRDDSVRPYVQILTMNLWAALIGSVLLVRGKLSDKGSYSVQLLFQVVLLALTMGSMWLSFGSSVVEWLTLLLVSVAVIVISWMADDDDSWVAFQFHLMFSATLPVMWAICMAYHHHLDTVFFSTVIVLTLVLALLCAGRMFFERVQDLGYCTVCWCNIVTGALVIFFLLLFYNESQVSVLGSASFVWIIARIYTSLSLHPMSKAGQTLFVELLLRFVLSVAMIKDLFT